jgi:hypothetical protein
MAPRLSNWPYTAPASKWSDFLSGSAEQRDADA